MIKKILVSYYALFCLFAVVAGFFLIQNIWMDSLLASVLGERWSVHLACDGAQVRDLSRLSVDTVRVVSQKGEILAAFKNGNVRVHPSFIWGNQLELRFESLILQNHFFKRLPGFFSPVGFLTKKPLSVKPVHLIAHRQGHRLFVHAKSMRCQALRLQGGILFQNGKMVKAHWVIFLYQKPSTRLLKDLFARMTPQKDGSKKARIVLSNNTVTLYGSSGPLFRADWDGAK